MLQTDDSAMTHPTTQAFKKNPKNAFFFFFPSRRNIHEVPFLPETADIADSDQVVLTNSSKNIGGGRAESVKSVPSILVRRIEFIYVARAAEVIEAKRPTMKD